MARVLIVGYGNCMKSDDGLGWQVAVQLFRSNTCPDVEVLPCHQLTPELAEPVSRAETVIFIDCSRVGTPGEVQCQEIRCQSEPGAFTHDLSPLGLLDLASQLFGCCPRAFIVSLCGQSFQVGETMSPAVRNRLPELRKHVLDLVAESLRGHAAVLP
jgi:hydrogenase maturation protease